MSKEMTELGKNIARIADALERISLALEVGGTVTGVELAVDRVADLISNSQTDGIKVYGDIRTEN
jgi:uncharacterized protein YqgV (UPF0045/DUF77 family)